MIETCKLCPVVQQQIECVTIEMILDVYQQITHLFQMKTVKRFPAGCQTGGNIDITSSDHQEPKQHVQGSAIAHSNGVTSDTVAYNQHVNQQAADRGLTMVVQSFDSSFHPGIVSTPLIKSAATHPPVFDIPTHTTKAAPNESKFATPKIQDYPKRFRSSTAKYSAGKTPLHGKSTSCHTSEHSSVQLQPIISSTPVMKQDHLKQISYPRMLAAHYPSPITLKDSNSCDVVKAVFCSICSIGFRDEAALQQHTMQDHNKFASKYVGDISVKVEPRLNGQLNQTKVTNYSVQSVKTDDTSDENDITGGEDTVQFSREKDSTCTYEDTLNESECSTINTANEVTISYNAQDDTTLNVTDMNATGVITAATNTTDNGCSKSFAVVQKRKRNNVKKKSANNVQKRFSCKVCDHTSGSQADMRKHMRSHTNYRPFGCKFCHKTFKSTSNLNQHLRTHTGELPYPCDVCDRRFNDLSSLRNHKLTHSGVKPFKCEECSAAFGRKSALKTHQKVVHERNYPLKCDICHKGFAQIQNLTNHLKNHHAP